MSVHAQTLIQWLEEFSPKYLAVEGDKIGLQLGTLNKEINKVLLTLDVTEEVVNEAIEQQVELIIAHHALIFRPLAHLRTDIPQGNLLSKLIKHDIAVYIAHTNLDIATGGINDWLAEQIGLEAVQILSVTQREKLKKLVTFVPETHERIVREALGQAGAGWIGNYSHCTFRQEGTGTFLPLDGTDPYIGQQGKLAEVAEVKIETIYSANIEKKVIQALLKAHPYEEVAYDLIPLENEGQAFGLGRIGQLKQEMNLRQFAEHIKQVFSVPACRVVGNLDHKVKKVAVLGGDGNKYWQTAAYRGADVYVTGDIYFHTAQDARMHGLNMVDPGHHVEKVMIKGVQQILQERAQKEKKEIEILTTSVHTEPFTFI